MSSLGSIFTLFGGAGVSSTGAVTADGGVGQFTFNSTTGALEYGFSAVPEPTSALAGLSIGAVLLRRRRSA